MKKIIKKSLIILMVPVLSAVLTGCPDAGVITSPEGHGTGGGTTADPVVAPPSAVYTLSFNGNTADTGDAPAAPTDYPEGNTVIVPGNTGGYDVPGWIFAGWCTTADGSGDIYAEGSTLTMGTDDVTLYARWIKRAYIADVTGLAAGYNLGGKIDLNGDGSRMITAAVKYSNYAGAIVFYNRDPGGDWEYDELFTIPTAADNDYFGRSLAIDDAGTVAVAGAYGYDASSADGSGCAVIFTRENGSWVYKHQLTSDSPQEGAGFGKSAAVSGDGNTIVIGEYMRDRDSYTDSGLLHIYQTSDSWETYSHTELDDTYSSNVRAGYSAAVNIDGTRIICGTNRTITYPRNIYIYDSNDDWAAYTKTQATGPCQNGSFGTSVACSDDGNTLCVGDYTHSCGEAYLFRYSEGSWVMEETFTSVNGADYDYFGKEIAMSGDGRILGAGCEQSDALGGTDYGNVYFFTFEE